MTLHYVEPMAWATPQHSKGAVDRAAAAFVNPATTAAEREEARAVINNWRSSHSFPLNTMQVNLRNRASKLDPDVLVAQRIKRLPSIQQKLERFSGMRLSRMQDIGGCRAVVKDMGTVDAVVGVFKSSRSPHELIREDDYIATPQASGYRSHHLIYRYRSDRMTDYDGLPIEVQVRTRVQHAWATAVETVGTFTRQALKSSRGRDEWLRFFALVGSAFAYIEDTPFVPDTPTDVAVLREEIRRLADDLDVFSRLEAFTKTLQYVDQGSASSAADKYFVLELDVDTDDAFLTVRGFRDQVAATDHFATVERLAEEKTSLDVVMVSVSALTSLSRAYPNYYLDTANFRDLLALFLSNLIE